MKQLMNSDQWQIKSSDGKGIRRKKHRDEVKGRETVQGWGWDRRRGVRKGVSKVEWRFFECVCICVLVALFVIHIVFHYDTDNIV